MATKEYKMANKTETKEFILKCKPVDPKDPTTLACRIVAKKISSQGEQNPDKSSKTSQVNPSDESEPAKTVPDATEKPGVAGDELLTVRKHTLDGKVFLEVIELASGPESNATVETAGKMDANVCEGQYCPVSKFAKFRKKKQAKNDDKSGGGE